MVFTGWEVERGPVSLTWSWQDFGSCTELRDGEVAFGKCYALIISDPGFITNF